MPVLVLSSRFTDDSRRLAEAAVAAGWSTQRLPGWRAPAELAAAVDLVFYGEPLFAAVVAGPLGLALLEPPFDWLPRLPERWRRRSVRFATFAEAHAVAGAAFIKPADDKTFKARVYADGGELPTAEVIPAELPVLIAEPVRFTCEYRLFVLDRAIVADSLYLRDGALAEGDGTWPAPADERAAALAFAGALLADAGVTLPPAVVLDVGMIAGRGWAVVECNPAWGSGLYGCDASAVLAVLRRACRPSRCRDAGDRPWIIPRGAVR